ncbi:hypothetical protein CJU35_03885 [Pseudomonas aeruginosa]|nr:hypothetical protein [Pseudomonas aeruginosa]PBV09003.1 hypothetical protein CJU35_03885 [Pseudomonas aeruginosa]
MNRKALIVLAAFSVVGSVAIAAIGTVDWDYRDKWAVVEKFKAGLPALLQESRKDASRFNVVSLGNQFGQITVEGLHVCAHEEIGADQYIKLSEITKAVSDNPGVSRQLRELLDSDRSVSDCQFRVLQAATGIY